MGVPRKLVDLVLTLYLLIIVIGAPLITSQLVLPHGFFPEPLVHLRQRYVQEFEDYLLAEMPGFFLGFVLLEFVFQLPLCLANLYGIWGSKPWVSTTCLMLGVSVLTSMAAILTEITASSKALEKTKMAYLPFVPYGVLAVLRGLLPNPGKATSATTTKNGAVSARKKRAYDHSSNSTETNGFGYLINGYEWRK